MNAMDYAGIAEEWKVEMAIRRARRMGFRRHDLEDAVQELLLTIVGFVYDPERAGGRSELQALCGLLDRRLIDMRRTLRRQAKFSEPMPAVEHGVPSADQDLSLDMRLLVERMPRADREICKYLGLGFTPLEIAGKTELSAWDVRTRVDALRVKFREYGLEQYLPTKPNSTPAALGQGASNDLRDNISKPVNQFDFRINAESWTAAEENFVGTARPA